MRGIRCIVDDGDVRVGVAGALPANSRVHLSTIFARLDLNNFDAAISDLTGVLVTSGVGPRILLGTATLTVGAGAFNGAITGSGGLVKTGSGHLILGGAVSSSYTGTTTIELAERYQCKRRRARPRSPDRSIVAGGVLNLASQEQIADAMSVTVHGEGRLLVQVLGTRDDRIARGQRRDHHLQRRAHRRRQQPLHDVHRPDRRRVRPADR